MKWERRLSPLPLQERNHLPERFLTLTRPKEMEISVSHQIKSVIEKQASGIMACDIENIES